MKKRVVFIASMFFCSLILLVPHLYAQALKIGVFDIQKIMRESKTIDAYRQQLLKNLEAKRKPFRDKEDAARQIEEKLRKERDKLSFNERRALEDRLVNEAKELRRLKEDIDSELQKMDRELTQQAFADIGSVIKKIAENEGYTIIFERSAAGIVHATDTVDITGKILNQLK